MTAGVESVAVLRPVLHRDGDGGPDRSWSRIALRPTPARPRSPRRWRSEGRAVARYPIRPQHRGHWPVGAVRVEGVSPLGGFVRRRTVTLPMSTVGASGPGATPEPADPRRAEHQARLPKPAVPAGAEIAGLREWQAGDPAARVHWRASARRNQLVVMERDDNQRIVVVVAMGRWEVSERWEQAVGRCAATAIAGIQSGHSVVVPVRRRPGHGEVRPRPARPVRRARAGRPSRCRVDRPRAAARRPGKRPALALRRPAVAGAGRRRAERRGRSGPGAGRRDEADVR